MNTVVREFVLSRHTLSLRISEGSSFMPNASTRLFSRVVIINPGDIVFDIGSGVGPLAIWAAREPSGHVYAVEIVRGQYDLLEENARRNGVEHKVIVYHGNLFDPIPADIRADVIIADVSGIAEGPARALGWYPPEVPTGGEDGTEVIVNTLEQAGSRLREGGGLYFGVTTSLSDSAKIMDVARSHFNELEKVLDVAFPLSPEEVGILLPLRKRYICPETKGSRAVWKAAIYRATNPR